MHLMRAPVYRYFTRLTRDLVLNGIIPLGFGLGALLLLHFNIVFGKANERPNELDMCLAYRAYLTAQVQSILDLIAFTGGAEGVARVRTAHTDQFDIRALTQTRCEPAGHTAAHVCTFWVNVATVKGSIEKNVTGCFIAQADGKFVFLPHSRTERERNDIESIC